MVGDKDFALLSTKEKHKLLNGKKPRVALNSVGGSIVNEMIKIIDESAVVVTYGGMGEKPINIGTQMSKLPNPVLCFLRSRRPFAARLDALYARHQNSQSRRQRRGHFQVFLRARSKYS